jgi:NAD(P)H-hydrate epimerase
LSNYYAYFTKQTQFPPFLAQKQGFTQKTKPKQTQFKAKFGQSGQSISAGRSEDGFFGFIGGFSKSVIIICLPRRSCRIAKTGVNLWLKILPFTIMEKYSPNKETLVMSRDQVRSFDAWAINELGIAGVVLMENAGRSCAELVKQELAGIDRPKVCIFCGTGNNGGDGFVIARHLLNAKIEVHVAICGDSSRIKGDAKINLELLTGLGQSVEQLDLKSADLDNQVARIAQGCQLIVDAIFGTGLQGQVRADYKKLIEAINAQGKPIIAVDIPSGLDCDTGDSLGAAIKAKSTVTFVAVKKGFAENPESARYTGDIYVASIGVEPHLRQSGVAD